MKKYKIGYTQGVYDMFHVGHLNLLNNAKKYCDYLIVGVNSDDLVRDYKNKIPVINQVNRQNIVSNIKVVDECIIVNTLNKFEIWKDIHFNVIFIGDDWKGNKRWIETEVEMRKKGVDVIYLPHTDGVSSTLLRRVNEDSINE